VTWAGKSRRALRGAAGVLFTLLLVVAPLNFGSTRPGGLELLAAGCALATLCWAASLLGGPPARVPVVAAACACLLTLAALPWLTGLGLPTAVSAFTQTHFAHVAARWPTSLVATTPAGALAFTLALTASTLALIDLAQTRGWALAFAVALVATAVAVASLALLQNYTHAVGIYGRDDGRMPGNFCGTFYHHTAAGAYFNTAWPLAVALAWLAGHRAGALGPPLMLAAALAVVLLLAGHGSHVSRIPQLAALVVAPFLLRRLQPPARFRRLGLAAGAAAVVLLIVLAGRAGTIGKRWTEMFTPAPVATPAVLVPESAWPGLVRDDLFIPPVASARWFGDRGESWRTAGRAIAARPLTGHGPGNWIGAASRHSGDPFVRTFFLYLQFTHQDFLQFAVEWGVPAALAWITLLVGALWSVVRTHARTAPIPHNLALGAAAGLAAVLLQAQGDFPLQMPAVAFNVIVLVALGWAVAARPVGASRPLSA